MLTSIPINISIIFATIIGIGGLGYILVKTGNLLVDIGFGAWNYFKKFWQPATARWFKNVLDEPEDEYASKSKKHLAIKLFEVRITWYFIAVLAAIAINDRLISFASLAIIAIAGEIYISTVSSKRLTKLNADTANLIMQFSSRYPLKRSISGTLEDAYQTIQKGDLEIAVSQTLRSLRLNRPLDAAMKPLLRLKNPTIRQMALLLSDAQETSPDVLESVMDTLQSEVKNRSFLYGEIRQSLTILRVTTRVLQTVFFGAIITGSTLANWRNYFLGSNATWMIFIAMITLGVVSSIYVELEIKRLEEA
jgi:hypothetical protein